MEQQTILSAQLESMTAQEYQNGKDQNGDYVMFYYGNVKAIYNPSTGWRCDNDGTVTNGGFEAVALSYNAATAT